VSEAADTQTTKLDEVAAAATDRADRGKKRGDKRGSAGASTETKEFWETWAENKSTEPAHAEAAADETAEASSDDRKERRGRDRGRGRDKKDDRATKDAKDTAKKDDRHAKKSDAKSDAKHDRKADESSSRSKRDAAPAAAADGNQARLFVSLGKKHGVSADDLRTLLAGPIGGDTARIGSVSLRDSHAHVRVPEDLVEKIIEGVHGTSHNDHAVTVERARA